jgi:hypothetical protein
MDFENDADFEMLELERAGRISYNLKKKGICTHGWRRGFEGNFQDRDNYLEKCLDCGKIATARKLDEDFQKYL